MVGAGSGPVDGRVPVLAIGGDRGEGVVDGVVLGIDRAAFAEHSDDPVGGMEGVRDERQRPPIQLGAELMDLLHDRRSSLRSTAPCWFSNVVA